ncbi:MAG: hypothetical protein PHC34_12330 [Candidatus Gastranaerophilales bacterium]|nr:hypothetical protein [Candidatus Gastranaerophilales bacterium]
MYGMDKHEFDVWRKNKDKYNVLLIRNNGQVSEIKGSDIEEKFDIEPNGIILTLKHYGSLN